MEGRSGAFHHSEARTMLGVSEATLRRLAKLYEEAFEALPVDEKGGRTYPDHALKRIQAARELFDEGRAANLETAFRLLAKGGEGAAEDVLIRANEPSAAEQLLVEFKGIRQALAHVSARLESLEEENQALRHRLEAPQENTREKELRAQVAELEGRNRALMGELERRRLEAEAQSKRRPRWQFWRRR